MSQESTGMPSFHLVYGGEAVILVEVRMESTQVIAYDEANTERYSSWIS